jgi:hypothetical protein
LQIEGVSLMGSNHKFDFEIGSTVTVLTTVGIGAGTGTNLGVTLGTSAFSTGVFTGVVLGEQDVKVQRDTEQEEHKCEYKKEIEIEEEEEFLALSLTSASYPFKAGQTAWVALDQIVAFTIVQSA